MKMSRIDKIICFDLETTGVDSHVDDVIEFSAVGYERGEDGKISKPAERIDEFVKTNVDIEKKIIDRKDENGNPMTISSLTHITNAMLAEYGISEKDMVDLFIQLIYSNPALHILLIGYNVNFDLNFIYTKIKKYYPDFVFERSNIDYLDVMAMYKDFFAWDKDFGHRLDAAVKNLQVPVKNTHRSIDDVDATYGAFQNIVKKFGVLTPYINCFGYNAKYGYETNLKKVTYIPQRGGGRDIVNRRS